jgi:hypothetical protein
MTVFDFFLNWIRFWILIRSGLGNILDRDQDSAKCPDPDQDSVDTDSKHWSSLQNLLPFLLKF